MRNDSWLMDVLVDLQAYANENGLLCFKHALEIAGQQLEFDVSMQKQLRAVQENTYSCVDPIVSFAQQPRSNNVLRFERVQKMGPKKLS